LPGIVGISVSRDAGKISKLRKNGVGLFRRRFYSGDHMLRGMTASLRLPRNARKPARPLVDEERGAAIVEMALVLPLLLALLMGVLVYGQYFMLAHSVQQAANDGARAAIVGLDAADRRAVATRAVGRSLQAVSGAHSVAVSETSEAITVVVTYTAPEESFLRSSLIPSPTYVIRSRATFELPVD
jgi:Flp pilus assembly protein TadG